MENVEFVEKVVTKCNERVDEFIFETMTTYCETITETKVSKALLIDALREYQKKHPEAFEQKPSKKSSIDDKINEIVEEYACYDIHSESCDNDCDSCYLKLKKELMELVAMVQKKIEK